MGFFDFLDDVNAGLGKVEDLVGTGAGIVESFKGKGGGASNAPSIFLPPGYASTAGSPPSTIQPGGGFTFDGNTLLVLAALAAAGWLIFRRR